MIIENILNNRVQIEAGFKIMADFLNEEEQK